MDLRRWKRIASFFALIAALLPAHQIAAESPSEHAATAQKEGELLWYTSLSIEDSGKIARFFEKEYPPIKARVFKSSSEGVLNRMRAELRAGKVFADVISTNLILVATSDAKSQGWFARYRSPQLPRYPKKFVDPDGYWSPLFHIYLVLGFNTAQVDKAAAPRSWADLLDEKWKGAIGLDPEDYRWYAGLIDYWGQEKAEGYLRALAKQNPQWRKGHTLLAQLVVAGEFKLGLVFAERVEKMKSQGAPIEWSTTTDPILSSLHAAHITADAPHPNAARLFMDMILSKEGQNLIRSLDRIPADPETKPMIPQLDAAKLPLAVIRPPAAEQYNRYAEEWRTIFKLAK